MKKVTHTSIETPYGTKSLSLYEGDIVDLNFWLDVMMVSAFFRSYQPTFRTLIGALDSYGISVNDLAAGPEIDLRRQGNIWLSEEVKNAGLPIKRIGCVELTDTRIEHNRSRIVDVLQTIKAFFKMIDLATSMGYDIRSIGLIIPGTGNQQINEDLIIVPLVNECLSLLKNNDSVNSISIIERSHEKAEKVANYLNKSYSIQSTVKPPEEKQNKNKDLPLAFISYSSADKNIADNLCAKLESNGIRAWYAPRDIDTSDYATSIVKAISRATHFIVILSHESLKSQHVLNEVDLAFQELNRGIRFYPLMIDNEKMGPSFKYYLSRQHWMDATYPPLENRLDEFIYKIKSELNE